MLRDRDVALHPEYRGLSAKDLRLKRIQAGRKVLSDVVTDEFLGMLYRALKKMHAAGVTIMDVKYGNVVIEEGSAEPRLIDFDQAAPLVPCGRFLRNLLFDHDTEQFNLHFGTHHVGPGHKIRVSSLLRPVCCDK